MKRYNKKYLLPILALSLVCGLLYLSGYRLSSYQAAKASSGFDSSAELFEVITYDSAYVHLFKTEMGFRTVRSEKKGFLWRSLASVFGDNSDDPVRVVGWMSYYDGESTVIILAVESYDSNVSYIEAGHPYQTTRKEISPGIPIVFSWSMSERLSIPSDIEAVALSHTGKALYRLGYPGDQATIRLIEWGWYPVKNTGTTIAENAQL